MKMLHDPAVRSTIESRVKALRPDAPRKWGTMTPDQMLWHLNQFMGFALGEVKGEHPKLKIPMPVMRFFLIYMPWPKGAPTMKEAIASDRRDFEAERTRLLAVIDRFANKPLEGVWPVDPFVGQVSGIYSSRLQAKHIDHHLRQFGG